MNMSESVAIPKLFTVGNTTFYEGILDFLTLLPAFNLEQLVDLYDIMRIIFLYLK